MEEIRPSGDYALLLHKGKGAEHYDLVLEGVELCPTFQLNLFYKKPIRSFDHRKKYLDFEGFISPKKGYVYQSEIGSFSFNVETKVLHLLSNENKAWSLDLGSCF